MIVLVWLALGDGELTCIQGFQKTDFTKLCKELLELFNGVKPSSGPPGRPEGECLENVDMSIGILHRYKAITYPTKWWENPRLLIDKLN